MTAPYSLQPSKSSGYFLALLILSVIAFWQPYFSHLPADQSVTAPNINGYKHFHVIMAVSWLSMLILQPLLIRYRQPDIHRQVGRLSYVLAPLMVLSIVLLSHNQVVTLEQQMDARRHFILFIQLGFALMFAVLYGLAIYHRKNRPIHSRYMVLTGILLIEPVLVRVFKFNLSFIEWTIPYQYVTWPMVDSLMLSLIIFDRGNAQAHRVFQWALAVFVFYQVLHLTVTDTHPWIAFAEWFTRLPLT